jgi:hypothetical protein
VNMAKKKTKMNQKGSLINELVRLRMTVRGTLII